MIVTTGLFMFNLLCSMVPCDMRFRQPEISEPDPSIQIGFRSGNSLLVDEQTIGRTSDPIVKTLSGSVQGFTMRTTSGRDIWAFEGIPYGESTGGYYRFRAPAPKAPWSGIKPATRPGEYCAQMHMIKMMMVVGSEDCLFLNIYTPMLPESGFEDVKLPVVVQIHGGSFIFGAGHEYGPSYLLAEKDVILVTINYRQGILGFMSTGDMASPGNYGLKDQALALKWVHENIEAFGGDKDKVTIMGQSGGAVSTHLHMISNVTRGFFSASISLSGSAFLHWGVLQEYRAKMLTKRAARELGCPTSSSQELVDCLRSMNFAIVAGVLLKLYDWFPFPLVLFGPVVEPEHPEAFLTEHPEDIYERGEVAPYPWMVSIMKQEGIAGLYALNLLMRYPVIRKDPDTYIPIVLDYDYLPLSAEFRKEILNKLHQFYFKGLPYHQISRSNFNDHMGTDRYFVTGMEKGIKAHSKIAPTFAYIFSFLSQYNIGVFLGQLPEEQGVCHGEDLFFYFNTSLYSNAFKHSDPEFELSKIMINVLGNFLTKRVPLYTDEHGQDQVIWDPIVDPLNLKFLEISRDIRMIEDPFKERVEFWESLGLVDMLPLKFMNKLSGKNQTVF